MNLYHQPIIIDMSNPFKVGDKVRCIDNELEVGIKAGDEIIVKRSGPTMIGFLRKRTILYLSYNCFELVERAEDISFNKQMREINA